MKKQNEPEYVMKGKNYNSIQRAEKLKNQYLANGYKILTENSKRITFIKK